MDAVEKQPIPWQRRKELGLLKALWQTAKQVLFKPGVFFDNLEIKDSYSQPLSFAISIFIPTVIVGIIINTLLKKGITIQQLLFTLVFGLVLVPILSFTLVPLMLFMGAGASHLLVLLFRGKGGFKGTFNVFAYNSAPLIFVIIPLVGMPIGYLWAIIVGVIGYKRVHKFTTIKAIFAYCFFIFFAIVLLTAIAIPNLLRAGLTANESVAQDTVKMISAAVENYAAANNGQYPSDEYDLKYGKPSYLDKIYSNEIIHGYAYSLNLNPNGYKITTTPSKCGVTGTKIFTIEAKGELLENNCKQ